MKSPARWIVFGLLGAAIVAVLAFPVPEHYPYVPADHFTKALQQTRQRWIAQSEMLRRAHGRELARTAVASLRSPALTSAFEIVRTSDAPSTLEAAVRRAADATYGDLPQRDSSVRLVIVVTVDTGPTIAGAPVHRAGWGSSTDTYLPGAISSNTCVIVVRAMKPHALTERRLGFADEPCYWFKAYGLPGRGVTALLDSTRSRILTVHGRGKQYTLDDAPRFRYAAVEDNRILKCSAGDLAVCEALVLGAPRARGDLMSELRTPRWIGAGRHSWFWSDYVPGAMFSGIERELGPDAFRQIWKSDAAFPVAFADAKGSSLGAWIHDAVVAQIPPYHRGPLPTPLVWLGFTIAFPGLIAIGAYGLARRAGTA